VGITPNECSGTCSACFSCNKTGFFAAGSTVESVAVNANRLGKCPSDVFPFKFGQHVLSPDLFTIFDFEAHEFPQWRKVIHEIAVDRWCASCARITFSPCRSIVVFPKWFAIEIETVNDRLVPAVAGGKQTTILDRNRRIAGHSFTDVVDFPEQFGSLV